MDPSAMADMDLDALMSSLSPEEVAQMEQLMKDMGDVDMGAAMEQMQTAMAELAKMSPEEVRKLIIVFRERKKVRNNLTKMNRTAREQHG